jgi:HicA toxin of bacterial toxin-antitoxin,
MHSRDVIKELKIDGWYEVNQVGSHKQFKHPTKKGRGNGAAPEPGYTDGHVEKHRETGGDQTQMILFI